MSDLVRRLQGTFLIPLYHTLRNIRIVGVFPFVAVAAVLQMRWAAGSSASSDNLYAGANQYVGEAFSSIRVIQAYNLAPYISGMYGKMLVRVAARPIWDSKSARPRHATLHPGPYYSAWLMLGLYTSAH